MVIIIGAGISGLSLAYFLEQKNIAYQLLEKSNEVGGYLQTKKISDFQFDLGANTILTDEFLMNFLKEIGTEIEIIEAKDVSKNRYILKKGKYRALPSKPQHLLWNNFFSWKTKWKIYQELKKKKENFDNETLSHFFERRFSKEIVDYALTPFVRGIYAGNPDNLLIEKTFPLLKKYEEEYGSVIRGFIKNKSTERKKTISFKNGMRTLPDFIAKKLKNITLDCEVENIQKSNEKYIIETNKGTFEGEKIVFALPSFMTSKLLCNILPESKVLNEIEYAPMKIVYSIYEKQDVKHQLNGFGGLNPAVENTFCLGSIWNSSIFEHRCKENQVMFTTFVGGSASPEKTKLSEQETKEKVHQELAQHYNIVKKPIFSYIYFWEKALPQYDKNCINAHQWIENQQKDNIFVCANWYGGVSLGDCIKKAKNLSENL
ncbi:MAG: protoporphyrinogen oxidase [Bacteroidetes bacterium]|nr:MAG: protoporphyrinogen oxidase [Bacteroidota bacterium]TAG90319.1 MAG: protoporphyrinogen oxidase [Bacteroidota bacterium]